MDINYLGSFRGFRQLYFSSLFIIYFKNPMEIMTMKRFISCLIMGLVMVCPDLK